MRISSRYNWLGLISAPPKVIVEAIKLGKLDTTEFPGVKSNPEIMQLAKEADVSKIYTSDETAWCAVAMVVILLRAGKEVPFTGVMRLRASSFATYGTQVKEPMLGDILVFTRKGGGHVGLYIGEDNECYHVAGGNQSNQYSVTRIEKSRLSTARRPKYSIGQPASVKKYFLDANSGVISTNEA